MSHDYHEGLPGYSPDHLLVDGCAECEERSASPDHGISRLDPQRFARAWARAGELEHRGLATVSEAEWPLLSTLISVQAQLSSSPARQVFSDLSTDDASGQ